MDASKLPLAVFDLDDTLSDTSHRQDILTQKFPNEENKWNAFYDACDGDSPNHHMLLLLHALICSKTYRIEIWTGRSDRVRAKTVDWLRRFMVFYPEKGMVLRMRTDGDTRHDSEVKNDWLRIEGGLPAVVFDDRNSVVDWWRQQGVLCCQVKESTF